jgi:hypothetical protein
MDIATFSTSRICGGDSKKYKDPHDWGDCIDGFFQVVKQTDNMQIGPVGAIVGPAHLVRENNAASD